MAANPVDHVNDSTHWLVFESLGGGLSFDLSPYHFYIGSHRFQLTKFMVLEVVAALLIIAIYVWPGRLARKLRDGQTPRGAFENAFEGVLTFIRDQVARPYLDPPADHAHSHAEEHGHGNGHDHGHGHGHEPARPDSEKFLPFLWTMFLFILVLNLLGMIPFMGSPTASLGITGALAVISFFVIHGSAIARYGVIGYAKAHVPDTGLPLIVVWPLLGLIVFIEMFGHIIKTTVLAVRLFANMFGGHTVLAVILGFIALAKGGGFWFYPITAVSVIGVLLLSMLELFVAFLQAYIFVFLTALFLGSALHPEH